MRKARREENWPGVRGRSLVARGRVTGRLLAGKCVEVILWILRAHNGTESLGGACPSPAVYAKPCWD
jgi:hypothetical protein